MPILSVIQNIICIPLGDIMLIWQMDVRYSDCLRIVIYIYNMAHQNCIHISWNIDFRHCQSWPQYICCIWRDIYIIYIYLIYMYLSLYCIYI